MGTQTRRAAPKSEPPTIETPEEILDRVHDEIDDALSDELLSLLIEKSPQFFDKFTVKLMERMGYGIGEETALSDDGSQRQCVMRNV